ncbi:hypothetical protein BAUCODRAFT_266874 [Baudoinia panamericana UAMH 10762]|uniref:Nuclear control of ATPase protein 2 n=1 Tax=Baudoinia panamericana (strain UAMH 10762) TaxID=717646 RepID=M2M951_BAUPA|nr:uncharacterized protein BAUCODRAFT_266874 [Baudoinia panamericana UAMH 10762]EMC92921.1 hypothetical protein BAUCODRAFT_266874 [Baudoinia panamericana UAMH 10762]
MSFVLDQVRRIDAQLDRVQLANLPSASPTASRVSTFSGDSKAAPKPSTRLLALQTSIRGLTPSASDSRALLQPAQIALCLSALSDRAEAPLAIAEDDRPSKEPYETELEWLLVSKATIQTYGLVLKRILDQTVALADDIWYWDAVLSSRTNSALHAIQISPFQFWHWSSEVWDDVKARGGNFTMTGARQDAQDTIGKRWQEFYGLVRQVIQDRSMGEIQRQVLSPVTRLRSDIRRKQTTLKKVRLQNANALGVLLGEGLANESAHSESLISATASPHRWKASVARNVALMEAVLAKVNDSETSVDKFDAAVAELTDDDPLYGAEVEADIESSGSVKPEGVAERLTRVLTMALPEYETSLKAAVREHGRPSVIVRYWLPVTVGIISSSTILRILVNRKADILQWVRDFGVTVIDFWSNWVVEPTRKVIKTIRHDEGSEVSIMSKRSLEGDRDSLERMVVDFAIDNPATATGNSAKLTEVEITDIRTRVREGDLTPVLKAYEKDLKSPFMGAVRGNLIRALLIQVQKTKVDVEVAIGGIDSLLKSQELVFGFVGLTPGILVTYFAVAYVRTTLSQRRGSSASRKQGKLLRQLRNIDRILVNSTPTEYGELFYKDQGLLLCEVHVLREAAQKVMPGELYREFSEDAEELSDVRIGAERQKQTAGRIRWAYSKYLA